MELDKPLTFKASGGETELDRQVLELVRDPITHLIRNAADHGIESRAVRSRFSLAEADLELVERWVGETRIRWGIDGVSRKELGLPEFPENTWRAGLDRMLLGYALPGRDELFGEILPYDRIEGGEAEVLGNFLGFMEKLFASSGELTQPRTLEDWSGFLSRLFETFFLPDAETEREARVIRRVLNDLAGKQGISEADVVWDLAGKGRQAA